MPEIDILQHLLIAVAIVALYYSAFAITIVGIAMMFGGSYAAQSMAQLLFAQPLGWLLPQLGMLVGALLAALWGLLTGIVSGLIRYVIDPLLRPIAYLIRVFLAGPPA